MRTFETGATRDSDTEKYDYEGFLSPIVLERFGCYMHKHRKQADGKLRDSDNWQRGIPIPQYMKSLLRHVFDLWKAHRGYKTYEDIEDLLCAIIFNAQGFLFEYLKASRPFQTTTETTKDSSVEQRATLYKDELGAINGF